MTNKLAVASGLAVLVVGVGAASAGGSKGSIGIGAEATLGGRLIDIGPAVISTSLGGVSANYDMGEFHLGGFLGFSDEGGDDDTDVALGARFYYHIHSSAMADFGVGGTVGLGFFGDRSTAQDNNATVMLLEPGFQIRAFVASNVALSFSAGISLGLIDEEGVQVSGSPVGAAGVHYYFF